MIPAGYMCKKVVERPEGLKAGSIEDICSVSGCCSDFFTDYVTDWKHNGYWFFNSIGDIESLCASRGIDLAGTTAFYYEVFEKEYDEDRKTWEPFEPTSGVQTDVTRPSNATLIGYDVVTFWARSAPECSPLSCNALAREIPVNRHCLMDSLDDAVGALEGGRFDNSEKGPFRVFAVYRVAQ